MGISIPIDSNNYDQKTQETYCRIFERILGINEASNELNFFYISKLQELIQEYNSDEYKKNKDRVDDYVILQHLFGLDGKKETDLGSISQLIHRSFISDVIMAADRMLKELRSKRELYDGQLLVLHYSNKISNLKITLLKLKKLSTNVVVRDEYLEKINSTKETIKHYKDLRQKVQLEYSLAIKNYKRFN